MSDECTPQLFEHGEDLGPEYPLLYLAMPLSHLDPNERQHVELLAYTIGRTITDTTRTAQEPWPVRVHSPINLPASTAHSGRGGRRGAADRRMARPADITWHSALTNDWQATALVAFPMRRLNVHVHIVMITG